MKKIGKMWKIRKMSNIRKKSNFRLICVGVIRNCRN